MLCSIACSILEITTACSIGMLCTMLCTMLLSASASSVAILAQVSFTSYPATFSGVCISFLTTQLCASALDAAVANKAEHAKVASATGTLASIIIRNVPSVAIGVLSTSMQRPKVRQLWWLMQTQHIGSRQLWWLMAVVLESTLEVLLQSTLQRMCHGAKLLR